ncbi:transcription initiation factor TFIID [Paenibacillaceae bacterium]|nr:transcription initiation factor TFIID [Paenibacillaceae bacterium]
MRMLLEQYAADYAVAKQKQSGRADDQSSIHYPTVFLFIGDETERAIQALIDSNALKWDNSAGVVYLQVAGGEGGGQEQSARAGSSGQAAESAQVVRVSLDGLPQARGGSRAVRKEIWEAFHDDKRHLAALNRSLRQVSDTIADYGRLYASFDRLHLAVVTRVDDPLNVLVPEIALLAQAILRQLFKSVQMDLYALVHEREQSDAFEYASSLGISFLRELEGMQRLDYAYEAPLLVTGDGLAIPVVHSPSPLFELVYVLSDRNERGMTAVGGMQNNYELIGRILLLKNKQQREDQAISQGSYNNSSFKNSLRVESGRQGWVSAGLAKLERPNHSIALTVLYHFCRQLIERLQHSPEQDNNERLAYFGVDGAAMEARVNAIVPGDGKIDDMMGLLTSGARYEQLRRMTVGEAEEVLFGDSAAAFFQHHIVRPAEERLGAVNSAEELRQCIAGQKTRLPQIGFYQIYEWTRDGGSTVAARGYADSPGGRYEGSVLDQLRSRMRETAGEIELAREELDRCREMRVDDLKIQRLPLLDKHNLRAFLRVFFDTIYRRRWQLQRLESKLALYMRFIGELERLHELYGQRVRQMEELEEALKSAAMDSIRRTDSYTGQNIFEYYKLVTSKVMEELEERRGPRVFFEERYVGNVESLIAQGAEQLAARMIEVCRSHLLSAPLFEQTFEEELLHRANVSIEYGNKKALTKEDLIRRLYRTLEENAVINIRLLDYTHEHRHEEKYLFGDADSEFVRYSLGFDESSRLYKLGCVHQKRSSGVEKLNLMGGFHLEDLLYYRNSKVYYETYQQNGYEFHGQAQDNLPQLR